MLRNYIITAFRNLRLNFSHTALNVAGLGVGLACCLVVFSIVNFEYSFDNWHTEKENIYRVTNVYHGDIRTSHRGIIPYPSSKVLKEEFPEIEKVVDLQGPDDDKFSFVDNNGTIQVYREDGVMMTNENFFDVLDFELISGNKDALKEPYQVFLSEDLAKKYFDDEDPIGRIITYEGTTDLTVAGIVENSPENTNLPYSMLISFETLKKINPNIWNQWGMTWAYSVYVKVSPDTDIHDLNVKIDKTFDRYRAEDDEEEAAKTEVALQPLLEIHNDERYGDGNHYVTPSLMIWAFVFLGGLVLGTACLNFINLNTAIAIKRSKEVGIRKTLGSSKKQLIIQFLMETLVVVVVSTLIALSLGQYLIHQFNQLITNIDYNLHYTPQIIFFSIVMVLIVTFLAGFYPSLILSGYQPVEALKNKINIRAGSGNFNLRRSLVIIQFMFTSIMLIGTFIIAAQVNYMKNKDLGFDPENVVKLETPWESKVDPNVVLERLKTKPFVLDATLAMTAPIDWSNWNNSYTVKGEEHIDGNSASVKFVDSNYMDFYDIPLIEGKPLIDQFRSDTAYNVIVTSHLLETLGWNEPSEAIGKILTNGRREYTIQGVCGDFNTGSAQNKIRPAMLMHRPEQMHQIALKLPSENLNEYLSEIESIYRDFYPNELFEISVLNKEIDERYMIEDLLHSVIQFVSALAIILSGMGLYGLVSFMANRNAKVIGIRKVFGATTSNILGIFTKEYFKLMVIAFIISAPIVYYLMNIWIEEFDYRIEISAKYFVMGFSLSLVIA
ncbi:MAG: ABC transporter permease, partial [Bacteroidota bacterium]